MPFPIPNANQTNDIFGLFEFSNDVSDGLFMPMMLLVIWVIAFVGSISEGKPAYRGWIFAFFIVSILSIISSLMNFINPIYMYFSILMLALGMFWAKIVNPQRI